MHKFTCDGGGGNGGGGGLGGAVRPPGVAAGRPVNGIDVSVEMS